MNTEWTSKAESALQNMSSSQSAQELKEFFLTLDRNTARRAGVDASKRLYLESESATSSSQVLEPAWKFDLDSNSLKQLQKIIADSKQLGVFASKADWFESSSLETFLRPFLQHKKFSYPRCGEQTMDFFECQRHELVKHPRLHVLEAPNDAMPVEPKIIFAPCTFADLKGRRMGRGRGYYDRYFSEQSPQPFKVAVLHENFVLNEFHQDWILNTDQPVDALLTNKRFIQIKKD